MRRIFVFIFAVCVLGACLRPAARGDTIIFKDGRKVEGVITEEGDDYYNVKIKIGMMKINKDMVAEIKKLSEEENLVGLGNQYLTSNNLDAAIEQYKKALRANPDYQPAKDALAKAEKAKGEAEAKKRRALEEKEKEAAEKRDRVKSGFGFAIESPGDKTMLADVISGGNAEAAGLKPKDEIIQINDMATKGKSLDEITEYLTKGDGAVFTFLIQRECELTRKKIDYQKHSFVGIGIFLDAAGDNLLINSVIVGEPADLAGLKSKDRAISIDGKPVSGMSVDEAAGLINGDESSKLKIVIQRSVELERK
ncbi:MAG: PDZ domain-containing protein [Candidatus Omnitrophica bacterium]|nr:PDZ domain-containing protein [Candidatus Omnitrophota bacterium]